MYRKYKENFQRTTSSPPEGATGDLSDADRAAIDEVAVQWQRIEETCAEKRSCPLVSQTRTNWQIVRVFVSSTFTDFHSEREVLMKKVFPAVREWCESQRLTLIECDLRWGIPTDLKTPSIIAVCMDELDRCCHENEGVPFFFNMISERYGWVPSKEDICEEVRERYKWISDISITHMEILFGAYRMFNPNALFFIRDGSFLTDLPVQHLRRFTDDSPLAKIQLKALKDKIQERFPEQILKYTCHVGQTYNYSGSERVKMIGLEEFEEKSIERLKQMIASRYPLSTATVALSEDVQETEVHQLMMVMKSEIVLGREKELDVLLSYARGQQITDDEYAQWCLYDSSEGQRKSADTTEEAQSPMFCVIGDSGMGKSAVLARLAKILQQEGGRLLYHSVGCTGASLLRENLVSRIRSMLLRTDKTADSGDHKKRNSGQDEKCASRKDTSVLIIDGLNEMAESSNPDDLSWLMSTIAAGGASVRCIVGANSTHLPTIAALKSCRPYCLNLTPLSLATRREIANDYFKKYSKKLAVDQMNFLVQQDGASLPLWLSVACDELRLFGDVSLLTNKISSLPSSLDGLLADVIDRLVTEDDTGYIKKVLRILYCSLGGCPEVNLTRLLSSDDDEVGSELPAITWAMLRRSLKPFLRTLIHGCGKMPRINLFHDAMKQAVKRKLIMEKDTEADCHRKLADFYEKQCDDIIYISEDLPHHLFQAQEKVRLVNFYRKDKRAMRVSIFYKRFYLNKLRCRQLTAIHTNVLAGSQPYFICHPCSYKTSVVNPAAFKLADSCIVCGALASCATMRSVANLCQKHAPHVPPLVRCCGVCDRRFMGKMADDMQTAVVCTMCNSGRLSNACCHLITE